MEWARGRATAVELRYAATEFKTQKERGKLASYNPTKDEVIGLAFVGVFERYHFTWEETEPYTYIPERRYQEWEQGFAEAVREYWETICHFCFAHLSCFFFDCPGGYLALCFS